MGRDETRSGGKRGAKLIGRVDRAVKDRVRDTDFHDRVGVGCGDSGQVVRLCELRGASVAVADHQPGVPDLDVVEQRDDALELVLPALASGTRSKSVERMGQARDAALLANGLSGLVRCHTRPDGLGDVQRDQVARRGAYFLAHDDAQ